MVRVRLEKSKNRKRAPGHIMDCEAQRLKRVLSEAWRVFLL